MSSNIFTDYDKIRDKNALCVRYGSTVLNNFRFIARNQADDEILEELTQEFFFRKILSSDAFVESYFKKREEAQHLLETKRLRGETIKASEERLPSFRAYLMTSVRHFWFQHHRNKKHDLKIVRDDNDENPILPNLPGRDQEDENIDPEVLYAYALLHRVLNQVRNYCFSKGLRTHWIIFDELVLAAIDTDRKPRTREELRREFFPQAKSNQNLDNTITTVKKMIDRHLRTLFVEESLETGIPRNLFDNWLEDLRQSNSFIHDAIYSAIRVSTDSYDVTSNQSLASIIEKDGPAEDLEKELGYAFYLRKKLPIFEWGEWASIEDLLAFVPGISPFKPGQAKRGFRPLTLEMLMQPSPAEKLELDKFKVDAILRMVKELAKTISQKSKNDVERQLFRVIYGLAIAIARMNHQSVITKLTVPEQQRAIWDIKSSQWIDESTRQWCQKALETKGVWYKD